MSAFLIRNGKVLAVNADIDALAEYAAKVKEATVFAYQNGYVSLYLNYADGAVGKFDGVDVEELRVWAESHKRWPACKIFNVAENYPAIFNPALEAERQAKDESAAAEAEAVSYAVRRTRTRPAPGPVKITRTRRPT